MLAQADAGAKFKVTGAADGWVRLDLGDEGFAFAKVGDVEQNSPGPAKADSHRWKFAVSPPRVALTSSPTQTDGGSVKLTGTATDEDAVSDVFITVYNPSRDLFGDVANPDPSSGALTFSADVPLTPGNNLVEIHARQSAEVVATKRMWVLRCCGPAVWPRPGQGRQVQVQRRARGRHARVTARVTASR